MGLPRALIDAARIHRQHGDEQPGQDHGLEPHRPGHEVLWHQERDPDGGQQDHHHRAAPLPPGLVIGLAMFLWCQGVPMPGPVTTTGWCRDPPSAVARFPSFPNSSYPLLWASGSSCRPKRPRGCHRYGGVTMSTMLPPPPR